MNIIKHRINNNRILKKTRIIAISDLHDSEKNINELKLYLEKEKFDFLILLGDIIHAGSDNNISLGVLKYFSRYKCFAINGNHEEKLRYDECWNKYLLTIHEAGIKLLDDENYLIEDRGINLVGLSIDISYYSKFIPYNFNNYEIKPSVKFLDSCYNIVLAHNPYIIEKIKKYNYELQLSGHMHGGGIGVGRNRGLVSPNLIPFPKYARGIFRIYNRDMIVSPGLGDHSIIIRLNNPFSILDISLDS